MFASKTGGAIEQAFAVLQLSVPIITFDSLSDATTDDGTWEVTSFKLIKYRHHYYCRLNITVFADHPP
jgi:hypothetical protein